MTYLALASNNAAEPSSPGCVGLWLHAGSGTVAATGQKQHFGRYNQKQKLLVVDEEFLWWS
jgi:hypothetical protein